ncbi:MAG: OmpH family outer membrane protein [Sphingobacteriales bacterium]|nr:MAG: OmpH family outer membrane protein [Sphingobacteriales bacterium]
MKKIVLFLAFGLLMIGNTVVAQTTTKFGYIDSRELLRAMPEITKADADLQTYAKAFQDQLQTMSKEYEKKVQDYQAQEKTMSEAVKEVKQKEIVDLQNRIESTNQSATEKVEKKREELYKPILEKADKAIKDVAKEKGFDYVFDASSGGLLHVRETDNLLPMVKTKLGIK